MGIINRNLKPCQAWKHAGLKLYNPTARPASLYGCETWAAGEQDK